jgi:signal transduction histidine kinase
MSLSSSLKSAPFVYLLPTAGIVLAAIVFLLIANGKILRADFLLLVPLVFSSYMTGWKIPGRTFFIVVVQLFAFSFFCQWLAWSQFGLITTPAALALAMTAAMVWGKLDQAGSLRAKQDHNKRLLLALKEKELKEAHLLMVRQDEADRRLLASDLHDQVLNDLKALRVAIAASVEDPQSLERINALLDQASTQVRAVMENLTPSVLENLGLASAIDDLLRRSASPGKFKTRFKNEAGDALARLSKIEELLLFRIVQEALSNIIKHASAKKVEITIKQSAEEVIIAINDDGLGIAKDRVRGQSRGLRYMRQRADLLGARISWLPGAEDRGCLVEIGISLAPDEDKA